MKKYLTKYEFRWAIIISLLSLLWTAFEYEMGWHDVEIKYHRYFTFLYILPLTFCFWLFLIDKKTNRFKKRFKFKHIFKSGIGLTLLLILFSIPVQYIAHYLITPEFIQHATNHFVSTGEMSLETAKKTFSITNFVIVFPILYLILGFSLSVFFGFLLQQKSRRR